MKLVFIAIAGLACVPVAASAQQQMPLVPVDKEVRMGKLDNGLTYYIRHNEYPKNQVDFYIALVCSHLALPGRLSDALPRREQ